MNVSLLECANSPNRLCSHCRQGLHSVPRWEEWWSIPCYSSCQIIGHHNPTQLTPSWVTGVRQAPLVFILWRIGHCHQGFCYNRSHDGSLNRVKNQTSPYLGSPQSAKLNIHGDNLINFWKSFQIYNFISLREISIPLFALQYSHIQYDSFSRLRKMRYLVIFCM